MHLPVVFLLEPTTNRAHIPIPAQDCTEQKQNITLSLSPPSKPWQRLVLYFHLTSLLFLLGCERTLSLLNIRLQSSAFDSSI